MHSTLWYCGSVRLRIVDSATFALPVAVEAQDAAIAAIATLGNRHEILRPAALQALESLMLGKKKEVAEKHLSQFKREAKVGA